MRREELDHVIRAAAEITGQREIVVVGSQAILAYQGPIPPEMLQSPEADLYPSESPELSTVIEGAIGAGSLFQETFGYHADGVGPETAKLPTGWRERAIAVRPANSTAVGLCPAPDDLAVSKLVSGRDKDLDWLGAGIRAGLFDPAAVTARLDEVPDLSDEIASLARKRLRQLAGGPGAGP